MHNQLVRRLRVCFQSSIHFSFAAALALAFLSGEAIATDKAEKNDSSLKIDFPVEKYILPNGLTVLLAPNNSVPMVSQQVWYRVGSRDEQPGVTGAAHMLEHMMFKGGDRYSSAEFKTLTRENGINHNAFTNYDYTGYFLNGPSAKLDLIMDLESDRMKGLKLDPKDLTSELKVVAEERRMRLDNSPHATLFENLRAQMFSVHPYRWPIIGWMEDVQSYTIEKIRPFYDRFYGPNNAVYVLSGDFDQAKIKKAIEKKFGVLKKRDIGNVTYPMETAPTKVFPKQILSKEVESESYLMLARAPSVKSEEATTIEVITTILSSGSSSRLYQDLIYKGRAASSAFADYSDLMDYGLFAIFVTMKQNESHQKVIADIQNQLQSLRTKKLTAAELNKAKTLLLTGAVGGLRTFEGRARALALNEILMGDYQELFKSLRKVESVTADQVMAVSQKYLTPESFREALLKPKGQQPEKNK